MIHLKRTCGIFFVFVALFDDVDTIQPLPLSDMVLVLAFVPDAKE